MARLKVNGGEVWHAQHQGTGTGMDADTVDGQHAAALLPSDRNLKEDVGRLEATELPLHQLANLFRSYRYKTDPENVVRFGVMAQDLQALPTLDKFVYNVDGNLHIDPNSTIFYLLNSLAVELLKTRTELESLKRTVGVPNE